MKRLVILLLILSLVLVNSIFAYADDSETSGSEPEVSESEVTQEMIDSEIHQLAENIVALESVKAATATHDVNDVYNLIYTYFTYGQTGSTAGLPSAIYNNTNLINNKLQAIMSSANSINTYTSSILEQITGAEGTTITLYDLIGDLLESIFDQLTITGSSGTVYGAAELLLLIESDIDDVLGKIDTLNQYVLTLSNIVASIQTISSTISSNSALIAQSNSSIASNTAETVNQLNNLRNDFNNINWVNSGTFLGISLTDLGPYISTQNFNNLTEFYISFVPNKVIDSQYYYLYVPVFSISGQDNFNVNDFNINVYWVNDSHTNPYRSDLTYYYNISSNGMYLYFDNFQFIGGLRFIIKVSFNSPQGRLLKYNSNISGRFMALEPNSLDSYLYINKQLYYKLMPVINKFEQLYASDDLIAAKEDQQTYEDQAIQDFTGSGSAAAGVSDIGNLKDVSGSLKSGISSGGSVSNALGVFNTSSSFWSWFSQDNYNDINTVHSSNSSNRLFKSGSGDPAPEVIDFYSQNWYDIQNSLGGD